MYKLMNTEVFIDELFVKTGLEAVQKAWFLKSWYIHTANSYVEKMSKNVIWTPFV